MLAAVRRDATLCIAFILFMEGAKHIPAAEAGLISMLDVVLGPLWVFLAFGEQPGPMAIVGGTLVLGALVWRLLPEIGRGRSGIPRQLRAARGTIAALGLRDRPFPPYNDASGGRLKLGRKWHSWLRINSL